MIDWLTNHTMGSQMLEWLTRECLLDWLKHIVCDWLTNLWNDWQPDLLKNWLTEYMIVQLTDWFCSWLIDWLIIVNYISQLDEWLTDWLIGLLNNLLFDWPILLIGWLNDWKPDWFLNWPNDSMIRFDNITPQQICEFKHQRCRSSTIVKSISSVVNDTSIYFILYSISLLTLKTHLSFSSSRLCDLTAGHWNMK